jgi:putative spermidine/putrescine transport system permease protein
MTIAIADIAGSQAEDRIALPRRLRRLRRKGQVKALLLIAPLLLFLLATFVVPIGALLTRSVDNSAVGRDRARRGDLCSLRRGPESITA